MTAPKHAKHPWLWPLVRQRLKLPYTALRRRAARRLVNPEAFRIAALKGARTRLERYGREHFQQMGRLGGIASMATRPAELRRALSQRGAASTNAIRWGARESE